MLADERIEMQMRYESVSLDAATARLLSRWLAGRIAACATCLARTAVEIRRRLDVRRSELVRPDWSGVEKADLGR